MNYAENVASEAIDHIAYGKEHARWLAAIAVSITAQCHDDGKVLVSARIDRVKALASLAQYLADDLANYSDCRGHELQQQLESGQAAQE